MSYTTNCFLGIVAGGFLLWRGAVEEADVPGEASGLCLGLFLARAEVLLGRIGEATGGVDQSNPNNVDSIA